MVQKVGDPADQCAVFTESAENPFGGVITGLFPVLHAVTDQCQSLSPGSPELYDRVHHLIFGHGVRFEVGGIPERDLRPVKRSPDQVRRTPGGIRRKLFRQEKLRLVRAFFRGILFDDLSR